MKSSINTFLAGKNPYQQHNAKLKNSTYFDDFDVLDETGLSFWFIDVLDDGTAITYVKE
jgi:hypothetical protein